MSFKTIKIGKMCCSRCIVSVAQTLDELGIRHKKIELGYAVIYQPGEAKEKEIELRLRQSGFEIIKSKEEEISERIKIALHGLFERVETDDLVNFNLRSYLETSLNLPYKKLYEIFSKQNHKTIENYFILRKIEKAKTMISESGYSFSEIAFKLGYNSPSYLSKQFKVYEGMSMRSYKLNPVDRRRHIDKL